MPDASASPLIETVETCLDRIAPDWDKAPVAVALSGGPDSMALFLVADHLCRRRGVLLQALHVNHGLRPEADAEAAQIEAVCRLRGRSCTILRWHGEKPTTGVHRAARDARYRLMAEACQDLGGTTLLVAHHLEDQAETLLHRIDRDSGPDGLAGMAPMTHLHGIRLLRPLLTLSKAVLEAHAAAEGVSVLRDPSNLDLRFARGRLREMAAPLRASGVTAARLGRLANLMGRARGEMDRLTAERLSGCVHLSATGYAWLGLASFRELPRPVARRVLSGLLQTIGGGIYPARGQRLDRAVDWLAEAKTGAVRTLGGCRLAVLKARSDGTGGLRVTREWRSIDHEITLEPGRSALWDGRFEISNGRGQAVCVRVAGECGQELWKAFVRAKERDGTARDSDASGWPGTARLALPAVVDLDGTMTLPHLSETTADPFAWIGGDIRVRYAARAVPDWLRPRCSDADLRAARTPEPVNGRQAT